MTYHKTHYKKRRRPIFTGKAGALFVSLFNKKELSQLAQLHYVEGFTLFDCAELMNYSNRHIERMHSQLKDIALNELVNLVSNNTDAAIKILQIQNIIRGGSNDR